VRYTLFSYRYGQEILESRKFKPLLNEILAIIRNAYVPKLAKPKVRTRDGKTYTFTTDQKTLNKMLEKQFADKGWEVHPDVTGDKITNLKADYLKAGIQVEVQFGNMARWYTDVFKFQTSYSLRKIDIGVLVVPMQDFANTIDENIADFQRVTREIPYAKLSITLPILIIGVCP